MNDAAATAPESRKNRTGALRAFGRGLRFVGRWTLRLLLLVLLLLVLVLLTLPFTVPWAAHKAGARVGLDVDLDDFSLSLMAGDLALRGLTVRALPGEGIETGEPLARIDSLVADLSMSDLFHGRVRLPQVTLSGLRLRVARRADGSVELPATLERMLAEPKPPEPEEPPEEPVPLDLQPKVQVDVAAVQLRLHVIDRAVAPALDRTIDLAVRMTGFGRVAEPFEAELLASSPDLLDRLRVAITGTMRREDAQVDVGVDVAGLAIAPCATYIPGTEPTAAKWGLEAGIHASIDGSALPPGELRAAVKLDRIAATADLDTVFALAHGEVLVDRLAPGAIDVKRVALAGMRGTAAKLADGTIRAAGLRMVPPPPPKPPMPPMPSAPPASAAKDAAPAAAPTALRVGEVEFDDFAMAWSDASMAPPLSLEPRLIHFETRDLVLDAQRSEPPISATLACALPGIMGRLDVKASSAVKGDAREFALDMKAAGLRTIDLAPWLAPFGVTPRMQDGTFTLATRGTVSPPRGAPRRADFRLENVALADGDELLGLDSLEVAGLAMTPERIAVESIAIANPRARVAREADGALVAAGARIAPPPAAPAGAPKPVPPTPPVPAVPPGAPAKPPVLAIGRVTWKGADLRFADAAGAPPRDYGLHGVDCALEQIAIGERPAGPWTLRFDAAVDGVAKDVHVEAQGSLDAATAGATSADAVLALAIRGIETAVLEGRVPGVAIPPELPTADFKLKLRANGALDGGRIAGGVELNEMELAGDGKPLFSLGRAAVADFAMADGAIDVGSVEVSGIRVDAQRLADGSVLAAGVVVVPARSAAAAAATTAVAAAAAPEPAPPVAAPPAAPPAVKLGRLLVDDVRVGWRDAAVETEVQSALVVEKIAFEGYDSAPASPPARFDVAVGIDGVLERLALKGTVAADPSDLRIGADLAVRGLQPSHVSGYLAGAPPIDYERGRVDGHLEARLRPAAAGGQDLQFAIDSFALRDGDAPPEFAFRSLAIGASRLDAAAGEFKVERLALAGCEVNVERAANGDLRVAGIVLAKPPEPPPGPATAAAEPAPAPAVETPVAPPAAPKRLLADVADLDIDLARIHVLDAARPSALDLALRLKSSAPILYDTADRPEPPPPIDLELDAKLDPAATTVHAKLSAALLAMEPSLHAELRIDAIDGAKLARLFPDVLADESTQTLKDGTFEGTLDAHLRLRGRMRPGSAGFDLAHGFGGGLEISKIALREGRDGPVLLGLDGLKAGIRRVDAASGDVILDSLEIETPRARIVKRADSLEVAGLRLLQKAEPPPAVAPAADPGVAAPAPVAEAAPAAPKPEMRIDEVVVHGLEFEFRDETMDPPLVVPLTQLDAQVRSLTSRALEQPLPIRFDVRVASGDADLPKRPTTDSGDALAGGIEGVGGAVGTAVTDVGGAAKGLVGEALGAGGKLGAAIGIPGAKKLEEAKPEQKPAEAEQPPEAPPLERRRIFDDFELKGQLALVPHPTGTVGLRVSGFELLAAQAAARRAGVLIRDGLLDLKVLARMRPDGGVTVDNLVSAENLSLAEEPDGPITRILALTLPLDAVVFILRDERGVLRIPLRIELQGEKASLAGVIEALTRTLGEMIQRAISRSPLRAVGTVGDVANATLGAVGSIGNAAMGTVGLDKLGNALPVDKLGIGNLLPGSDLPAPVSTSSLEFAVGEASLDAKAREAIKTLGAQLADDPNTRIVLRHRFAQADVARADELVNPPPESIGELLSGLRRREAELFTRRDAALPRLRAAWLMGDFVTAHSISTEVRGIQENLGRIADTVDELLELREPDSGRRRESRAKTAAMAVAAQRLAEVRRAILAVAGQEAAERVSIVVPRIEPSDLQASFVDVEFRAQR